MGLANTMRDSDARTLTKGVELSFDSVTKRFPTGTVALEGIDLRVRRGDFVAVVGPSGCGKSTLLRMAAGLERPTSGSAAVATESVGFIFQEPTLLPWRSVRRNVELSIELRGADRATRRARADAALAAVGLTDFAGQLPKTLSGGMKMRASLARALTLAPEVLLLDEPFGALDEMTRLDMQGELQKLYSDKGFTAMFITHSVSEAVFLANRVVVMTPRPGRIADVIDIDFPYPRDPGLRYEPAFTDHVSRISASLHGGTR
ncbi:ABC transporter ATP-binding protein [Nocardia puris]|uniref:NitT/TauT family transport system ATP-binding protein n=1 Tax=Nocardia puris TaxID=208602 RepID=A0A366E317_9NOCA|nr:ABC transporter ATP-binding protein [Nocardia puris]MBF6212677.1 ABC transporter ATP-binding protein [Nocardia puris]MBF6367615.1 ABC transporter ATP-binding protein [Nocardia puris]MBF6461266.1 ABC transporter ATP-binding protein [Nocardia puris]RBO96505.1 NitT/TauT family transport system ATP-binding protein [Nocardia puris]